MSRRRYFIAGLGGAVAGTLVACAAVDLMVMDASRPPQRGARNCGGRLRDVRRRYPARTTNLLGYRFGEDRFAGDVEPE